MVREIADTDKVDPVHNDMVTLTIDELGKLLAAEREACAKVCEQPVDEIQITDDCSEYKYRDNQECADAIRARGSDAA